MAEFSKDETTKGEPFTLSLAAIAAIIVIAGEVFDDLLEFLFASHAGSCGVFRRLYEEFEEDIQPFKQAFDIAIRDNPSNPATANSMGAIFTFMSLTNALMIEIDRGHEQARGRSMLGQTMRQSRSVNLLTTQFTNPIIFHLGDMFFLYRNLAESKFFALERDVANLKTNQGTNASNINNIGASLVGAHNQISLLWTSVRNHRNELLAADDALNTRLISLINQNRTDLRAEIAIALNTAISTARNLDAIVTQEARNRETEIDNRLRLVITNLQNAVTADVAHLRNVVIPSIATLRIDFEREKAVVRNFVRSENNAQNVRIFQLQNDLTEQENRLTTLINTDLPRMIATLNSTINLFRNEAATNLQTEVSKLNTARNLVRAELINKILFHRGELIRLVNSTQATLRAEIAATRSFLLSNDGAIRSHLLTVISNNRAAHLRDVNRINAEIDDVLLPSIRDLELFTQFLNGKIDIKILEQRNFTIQQRMLVQSQLQNIRAQLINDYRGRIDLVKASVSALKLTVDNITDVQLVAIKQQITTLQTNLLQVTGETIPNLRVEIQELINSLRSLHLSDINSINNKITELEFSLTTLSQADDEALRQELVLLMQDLELRVFDEITITRQELLDITSQLQTDILNSLNQRANELEQQIIQTRQQLQQAIIEGDRNLEITHTLDLDRITFELQQVETQINRRITELSELTDIRLDEINLELDTFQVTIGQQLQDLQQQLTTLEIKHDNDIDIIYDDLTLIREEIVISHDDAVQKGCECGVENSGAGLRHILTPEFIAFMLCQLEPESGELFDLIEKCKDIKGTENTLSSIDPSLIFLHNIETQKG